MSNRALFDEHFQANFLAHMLRDSHFLLHVKDEISPDLFSNELAQRTVRLVKDHGDQERAAPGHLIFRRLDEFKERKLISDETHKSMCSFIDQLFGITLQNREFLIREFDKFVRHQRFARDILPATALVKAGDFDKAEEILRNVFTFRAGKKNDLGRHFDVDPTARIQRRYKEDPNRFWLLIPELDMFLGGHKAGQLFVWQSQRSSGGKSAALVFCARSFVFQAKKVLIISLEMDEEDYEDRLDMCIAGLTSDSLMDHQAISHAMHRMFGRSGDVWIKQMPGRATSVAHMKEFVATLKNVHNFVPEVVIVDYADEMIPVGGANSDSSYNDGKVIYSELRGWAVEDQLFIMTAMQSNRSGMEAAIADMEHSSESLGKQFVADDVISINRSPAEAEAGLTTLFVVKHRRGVARFKVTIRTDFNKMQFWKRNDS